MSGNSIRYFLDGMPLDAKGSGVTLANLPPNIIDRIEIYKGVVPAHLGTDALGGAVNIITNQQNKNFLDVAYSVSSFHTHQFNFNAQYVEQKTGIFIKPIFSLNSSKNDYKVKNVEVWNALVISASWPARFSRKTEICRMFRPFPPISAACACR